MSSSGSSSSEKIKRRKESAVVGHTMMGVFWPMVVLQKHFKDQKKPRIKRSMKYNGVRGAAVYSD